MSETPQQQIFAGARVLFRPGDVVELRVPKAGAQRVISGYFDDIEKLAQSAAQIERAKHPGVYWTLNPVNPDLLSRASNRTQGRAESTTNDGEIVCRRWLPVDLDPKRPAGISSSDEEHEAALALAERIRLELAAEGWPAPILADSGNGAHLLYSIDLPNDAESADLLKRVLEALAARFNGGGVEVDRTTFNASRIFKVYGTTARKGDHTDARPHRLSRLLDVPGEIVSLAAYLLRQMASRAREPQRPQARTFHHGPRSAAPQFSLAEFLTRHGILHRSPVAYDGGTKYVLEACPFDANHKAPDAMVWEGPDGRLGFKCLHNSCADRHWAEFRELFEPKRERPQHHGAAPLPSAPWPEGVTEAPPPAECDGEAGRDKNSELPLSAGDVEAAVDAAIEAGDLPAAMRLISDIARSPLQTQVLVQAKLRAKFKREFPARDFSRALKESAARQAAPPVPPDDDDIDLPEEAPDLTTFPLTDSGNGERIIALHGRDIRYCVEFKKWLFWDTKRWRVDEAGEVTQKAKLTARLLHKQAKAVGDSGWRKVLQDHARASESHGAIVAALNRAATEPGVAVYASDLDQHRYLLNCQNGVVDVRTPDPSREGAAVLLPHDRSYLITKLCPFEYKPEAQALRFQKFVNWAMGESPDDGEERERIARLVGFLQKSFGYALTGDVSEKAAFIFYGRTGNNGKTTLLTIFTTLLQEYSTQLDINTLMTTKLTDNNIRADMAKLHGARFVITSEVDDGQRLSERLMKYLTAGMGKIVACRKFENPIEFDATHKIFMDANYRPTVRGSDEAIWGRLMCVPFEQHLDKDDPTLDKKLKDKILAEAEGVLAWAIRGALRWAKEGLGVPPEIKDAVKDWRESDDPLKDFLEDCCETGDVEEGYYVLDKQLSAAYNAWCKDAGERAALGRGQFKARLELKGYEENRSRRDQYGKQQRWRDGLRLKEDVTLGSRFVTDRSGETTSF